MTLAAAQIMDAIATRITGLPLAGARVYTSRAWPIADDGMPAWKVIGAEEDIEPTTVHPVTINRHRLQVELHGFAKAVANLDDAMHALASEALTAIFNAPLIPDALSALNKVIVTLRRIERAMQSDGEAVIGLITVTLRAEFNTRSNAPETII